MTNRAPVLSFDVQSTAEIFSEAVRVAEELTAAEMVTGAGWFQNGQTLDELIAETEEKGHTPGGSWLGGTLPDDVERAVWRLIRPIFNQALVEALKRARDAGAYERLEKESAARGSHNVEDAETN